MARIDGVVTLSFHDESWELDSNWDKITILQVNEGFEKIASIKKEDIVGKSLDDLRKLHFNGEKWFKCITSLFQKDYCEIREDIDKKNVVLSLVINKPNEVLVIIKLEETPSFESLFKFNKTSFENFIEDFPIGIQINDKNGFALKMNSKQAEILGLPNKIYGIGEFNVLNSKFEFLKGTSGFYNKVYSSSTPSSRIFELDTLNFNSVDIKKHVKIIHETAIPLKDVDGNLLYTITLLEDVTARINTENALKDSEHRWHFAIEGTGDGLWDYNIKKGEVSFSNQWKSILGYDQEEIDLNLQEWRNRVHPDDLQNVYADIKKHVDGETEIFMNEYRIRKKDNTYIWVLDRGKIMERSEDGSPARIIGTITNITYRKNIEYALRNSEEIYRSVVNTVHDGIVLLDKEGRVETINKAAEKILGIQQGELPGIQLKDFGWKVVDENGNDLQADQFPIYYTLHTGKPKYDVILGNYKPDGSLSWLTVNTEPIFIHDKENPSFVVASFFDITQHINTEKLLRQEQAELIEINEAKDRFLSILGHDLRSPFNQMGVLIDFIRKDIADQKYDEIGKLLDMITKASNQGNLLLSNLLEWSRSQMGRINVNPSRVSIKEISLETIDLLTPTAFNKNIILKVEIPDHIYVWADRVMIKTVLRNIVANSIKFSYSHSSVILSAKEEGQHVEVSVTDEGLGIKEEDIEKLFSIKKTYTTLGTASEKGSGLGLLICKDFIEKNGGKIWVKSKINNGSVFYFSLPKG